jgi:pyruvate formate lyase activating enzyme
MQSFSLHNGPGIRTTIFFKGCPLDCLWCHNPEAKEAETQLLFHRNLCTRCMLCVTACKIGARDISDEGRGGPDRKVCVLCGKCLEVCVYNALTLSGASCTAGELLEKLRSDMRYFQLPGQASGTGSQEDPGGVTFSGGEPLLYAPFIKNFCTLIPGIHTCLETSGYGPWEQFEILGDAIDLYLFDIKVINREQHRAWCGGDNEIILANLDLLYRGGKKSS